MKQFFVTTSWDDGSVYDLKLAELLSKYEIPATFYIPIKNPERKILGEKEIRNLSKEFEVGGHTVNHKILTDLSLKEAKNEISLGKKKMEDIIGRKIFSFCYPKGMFNQDVKQLVGFSGFTYARTVKLFEMKVMDKLLAGTTVHVYDHNPLVYMRELGRLGDFGKLRKIFKRWDDLAIFFLEYCKKVGGIFHLWGHSWEIEEAGDWKRLERVFTYIRKHTKKDERKINSALLPDFEKDKKKYYKRLDPARYKSSLKFLKSLIAEFDKKGMNVLDIGCGNGQASELFERSEYFGIDYAKNFINYAKKRYPDKKFYISDYQRIERLDLPKQDLIIIWGMFEDATDPFSELESIRHLVKRRTSTVFSLHNSDSKVFKIGKLLQSKVGKIFPYTSFSKKMIEREFGAKVIDSGRSLVVIFNA